MGLALRRSDRSLYRPLHNPVPPPIALMLSPVRLCGSGAALAGGVVVMTAPAIAGTVSGTATFRERIKPAGQHPEDKPRQGCPQPARTQKTSDRGQPRRQLVAPLRGTTWKLLALGGETVHQAARVTAGTHWRDRHRARGAGRGPCRAGADPGWWTASGAPPGPRPDR
jgi:hypothetical protein